MFFPHSLEWIFSVFLLPYVSVTLCLFVCYVLSPVSWAKFLSVCQSNFILTSWVECLSFCLSCFFLTFLSGFSLFFICLMYQWPSLCLSAMFYPQFLERSFCLFVCQILSSLLELSICRFVGHVFSSLSWVDFLCFSFAFCISDPLSVCLLRLSVFLSNFILTFLSGVSFFFPVTFYPHLKVRFEVCSTIYDRRCLPVC